MSQMYKLTITEPGGVVRTAIVNEHRLRAKTQSERGAGNEVSAAYYDQEAEFEKLRRGCRC